MKHQRHEFNPDESGLCQDCPRVYVPAGTAPAEFEPVLTRITEDLWVNPAHVVSVEFFALDSQTSESDPKVVLKTVDGRHVFRSLTLAEVVALLNGSA